MSQQPADYFGVFQLPRNLNIDLKDLEYRFYALSRELHPDRFARRPLAERTEAEEKTALLNSAYRSLKDPVQRTAHLLALEGFDIGEQGTKDVPPELLEEVFELNMALEDNPAGVLPRFDAMRAEVEHELHALFTRWDAEHQRDTLVQLRSLLNRRKYISNLIDKANNVPDRI